MILRCSPLLFARAGDEGRTDARADSRLRHLGLKTAFQIGFIVFIPFLIIDMVVASVLMSMGMMMMSPVIVALPFKIMLFVLVDGSAW